MKERTGGGVAREARRWFAPAYAPDPAVAERGRHERFLGVGVALAGSVAIAGAAVVQGVPAAVCAGALVWQGIAVTGQLARDARARDARHSASDSALRFARSVAPRRS
jgi:hypothetical protein